jgi:hypothetical protein
MRANTAGGIGTRKYRELLFFLKQTLAADNVPIEVKVECAKELNSVLRRFDTSREREKARSFKLQLAQLGQQPEATKPKGKEKHSPTAAHSGVDMSAVEALYASRRKDFFPPVPPLPGFPLGLPLGEREVKGIKQ